MKVAWLKGHFGLDEGFGEAGLVAEVVVAEHGVEAVEAFEEGGEEFADGGLGEVGGEVAVELEGGEEAEVVFDGEQREGVGAGFGEVGFDGAEAGFDLVEEVEDTVGGVGLLEEEAGDVAGLAAGLVEAAVNVLGAEHAEEGGEFGVIAESEAGVGVEVGGAEVVGGEGGAEGGARHDGAFEVEAHAEEVPAGVVEHGVLGGAHEGVDLVDDLGEGEIGGGGGGGAAGGGGAGEGFEAGAEAGEDFPALGADVVAELAGVFAGPGDGGVDGAGVGEIERHVAGKVGVEGGLGVAADGDFLVAVAGGFEEAAPEGEPAAAVAGGDFFKGDVVEDGEHAAGGDGAFEVAAEPEKVFGGAGAEGVEAGGGGGAGFEVGDLAGAGGAEEDEGIGGEAHAGDGGGGVADLHDAAGEDVDAVAAAEDEGAEGGGGGVAAEGDEVKGFGAGLGDVAVGVVTNLAGEDALAGREGGEGETGLFAGAKVVDGEEGVAAGAVVEDLVELVGVGAGEGGEAGEAGALAEIEAHELGEVGV